MENTPNDLIPRKIIKENNDSKISPYPKLDQKNSIILKTPIISLINNEFFKQRDIYSEKINKYKPSDFVHNWFENEINFPLQIPKEKVEFKRPLRIKYDATLDGLVAGYYVVTNEIIVGPQTLSLTDGNLEAIVAHEKSHALFSGMSLEKQREIITAITSGHKPELNAIYTVLRKVYKKEYFEAKRALLRNHYASLVGKGYSMEIMDLDNNGVTERIDAGIVIDELIAFANTNTTPTDTVGQDDFIQAAHMLSRSLVDLLDEQARKDLLLEDMIEVDASKETKELKENPQFQQARAEFQRLLAVLTKYLTIGSIGALDESLGPKGILFSPISSQTAKIQSVMK